MGQLGYIERQKLAVEADEVTFADLIAAGCGGASAPVRRIPCDGAGPFAEFGPCRCADCDPTAEAA